MWNCISPPSTLLPALPRVKAQIPCCSQICQKMCQHVVEHRNVCHTFMLEHYLATNIKHNQGITQILWSNFMWVIKRILNTIRRPLITINYLLKRNLGKWYFTAEMTWNITLNVSASWTGVEIAGSQHVQLILINFNSFKKF